MKLNWRYEKRTEGSGVHAAIEHNIPVEDYPFIVWVPYMTFAMGAVGALVAKSDSIEESEQRAQLIAAAPDLLDALEDMCAEFRGYDLPYGSKSYEKATSVINRAKGWKR